MELKLENVYVNTMYSNIEDMKTSPIFSYIEKYGHHPELMHTIFYGYRQSGKYFYLLSLLSTYFTVPLSVLLKKTRIEITIQNRIFYIYKTNYFFEINVEYFLPYYMNHILMVLMELSSHRNILNNKYNIIIVRHFELLDHPIQHQLRRIMETIYSSCRLLFSTTNLSRIDSTIMSRCYCIRIPKIRSSLPLLPFVEEKKMLFQDYSNKLISFYFHPELHLKMQDIMIQFKILLRNIIVKHIDLETFFIQFIITMTKKVSNLSDQILLMIVQSINHYMYIYNISYRKEYCLEALFASIWNHIQQTSSSAQFHLQDNQWI